MDEAAPQAARAAGPASGTVCRRCAERVTVTRDPELGRAVHASTGEERGPDGHIAASIDAAVVFAARSGPGDRR